MRQKGPPTMRFRLTAVLALLALVAAGCGDADDLEPSATSGGSTTTSAGSGADDSRVVNGVDLSGLALPDAESYEEFVLVEDETAQVEVEVPTAWDDVDGRLALRDDVEIPGVWASTDLEALDSGYSVPGTQVDLRASSTEDELLALLNGDNSTADACGPSEQYDYDDGRYAGSAELWVECGEDDAALLEVVALRDGSQYVTVEVQMVDDADIDAAVQILQTFTAVDVDDGDVLDEGDGASGQDPLELTTEVGKTVYVGLPENASVGDAWEVLSGYDESVLELLYDDYESSDPTGTEAGAGGLRYFYFDAVGPGSTTVEFGNCFGCFPDGGEITETRTATVTVG